MASVTQLIPTLTGGISQQPDELKIPGQLNVADNVLPDVTHGLLKRPSGQFIKSLSDGTNNSQTNGKWFHYYRDENEQYIGQVSRTGDINMWKCSDGSEMNVVGSTSAMATYLTHSDDEDIQTLTINDFTFITNRLKTVAMSSTKSPVRPPEVYLELDQIKYAAQYSLNIFDSNTFQDVSTCTRLSGELVRSSNNYCNSDGSIATHVNRVNNTTRCNASSDSPNDDDVAPNVGTRIFEVGSGVTLVDNDAISTDGGTDFSYQANIYNAAGTAGQNGRSNLYFRITTTGQSTPVGSGSNVEYRTRYTTNVDLLYGGEGWQTGDHFYVYMKDGYYKITIDETSTASVQANLGLIRPNPTSFDTKTTVTAESILGTLRSEIIATGNFTSANVQIIGNGIYITRPSNIVNGVEQNAFNITAPNSELINVVAGSVLVVDDLPRQCKNGMVILVRNSADEKDDYYVRFDGDNGKDGTGTFEECVAPNEEINFDAGTMPLQLVRTNATTFTLSTVAWDEALVGTTAEDGTNPRPSFVGSSINKMVFFRNRLVMLSGANIIMSRPGDFFNFFAKTATTFSNVDPIDLSCSSTFPAIVFDAIQVNSGLVIFTKNQQFMLTTDSDVLNPNTAKINALAAYNFNHKTNPISLGTTIGFLDNAGKNSRFFEMSNIRREGEPQVVNQSQVVSELLTKNLTLVSSSRENNVIFFSELNTNKIFAYRYFDSGNKRILAAWFSWTITGNVIYHCMLDDALHVVVRNNNKDQLLKYSIKQDTDGNYVTSGQTFTIHLDHAMSVTTASNTYANGKTTFPKPTGLESTKQLVAYDADTGNNLGRYGKITVNGSNLELDGDWSGETFIIGYLFDMQVELPTIFFGYKDGEDFRADTRADLIVHRLKFSFGDIGVYKITLDRDGKPQYIEEKEVNRANQQTANTPTFLAEDIETIPTYERNKNLKVTVSSEHPSPATMLSYQWEGQYTNKSYKRV
jgi:hypothetical protein